MSLVRENLMSREGYSPYCGGENCRIMPRTIWNGEQFECHSCGWKSQFPADFIAEYKAKWHPIPDHWPEQLTVGQKYLRDSGETPESLRRGRMRDQAAKDKRERRRLRNIKNEAARQAGKQVAP